MDMSSSSGVKRRIGLVYNYSSSRAELLRGGDSVSDSPTISSYPEEYVYKRTVPAMLLRDLLAGEVSNYIRIGISGGRCALCPFREPPRPFRVRLHVRKYHIHCIGRCASGGNKRNYAPICTITIWWRATRFLPLCQIYSRRVAIWSLISQNHKLD